MSEVTHILLSSVGPIKLRHLSQEGRIAKMMVVEPVGPFVVGDEHTVEVDDPRLYTRTIPPLNGAGE